MLRALHRELVSGLCYCNATFTAGFLASRKWGDGMLVVNGMMFFVSSYSFYAMMWRIDSMLTRTQECAAEKGVVRVAWQFVVTRNSIFCVWHIFPFGAQTAEAL